MYSGAGGFPTIQEMFCDITFIEMLLSTFGNDAVPSTVVQESRRRDKEDRLPFPDDTVEKIEKLWGIKVTHVRARKRT
jgi:hypothetical protein